MNLYGSLDFLTTRVDIELLIAFGRRKTLSADLSNQSLIFPPPDQVVQALAGLTSLICLSNFNNKFPCLVEQKGTHTLGITTLSMPGCFFSKKKLVCFDR